MTPDPEWAHPADERILDHFAANEPDYVPLAANRLGMHLEYVERRVDRLVEAGLLEAVTGEVVYATTAAGEAYLAAEGAPAPVDAGD